jgi:hypothetical protein
MNVISFPSLERGSSDESEDCKGIISDDDDEQANQSNDSGENVDDNDDTRNPTAIDSQPAKPLRNLSPKPDGVVAKPSNNKKGTTTGTTSHRKIGLAENPLDAFAHDSDDEAAAAATAAPPTVVKTIDEMGYEDAVPDVQRRSFVEEAKEQQNNLYGYEDAKPVLKASIVNNSAEEFKYPTKTHHDYDGRRVPRRSSLKSGTSPTGPGNLERRASMGGAAAPMEIRIRGGVRVHRRRSIEFAKTVQIKEVTPIASLADSCSDLWLNEEEFRQMKSERRQLVKQVKQQGGVLPTDEFRGLEKYVDKSIRITKNRAWDTVLLEQDEQEVTGDYNDERIADLYKHYTKASPTAAFERAQNDEQEIQDYLWSPRTTKLMMRRLSM